MADVDWSNYDVVDEPSQSKDSTDWKNYEVVPETPPEQDKTLRSQISAIAPQVAAEQGITFPKEREGLSPRVNDALNAINRNFLIQESTRRAKQSAFGSALEGLRDTSIGLGKSLQSPENAGLALLAAVAPQVALPIIVGMAAKQIGESAGKLSVPGTNLREAIPEIVNPILMTLATKGTELAAREAMKVPIDNLEKNYEVVPESEVPKSIEEPIKPLEEAATAPTLTAQPEAASTVQEPVTQAQAEPVAATSATEQSVIPQEQAPEAQPSNPQIELYGGLGPIPLLETRAKLANSWATRGNKADIARLKDAADNDARIFARQKGNSVAIDARTLFGEDAQKALNAIDPVIESGGDPTILDKFIKQSQEKNEVAYQAAQFAKDNWDMLHPLAAKVKQIHDGQIATENLAGINTTFRDNYIKHAFDVNKLPNRGAEFFGTSGSGRRSGFKAERKFNTIYDAIEAGYGNAVQTLDASKLVESRIAAGQQLVNDRAWVNTFRGVADPTTGNPLVSDITFDANHYPHAPPGYDPVQVLPGQFVAVHNGYQKIFRSVTGESKIGEFELGGLPVGEAAMQTVAALKHSLLVFDTFHASRVMQKQFFLTGKVGWNKGLSILEYDPRDLNSAVRNGEITQDMADYAKENHPIAMRFIKQGLNVGRIAEALRAELVRNIPVVGTMQKWVFEKVTRGAMLQSAISEAKRFMASGQELTDAQIAKIAKDVNITFGNIGRQGLFRSRTMQDLSRLFALAPQWVESMARSEILGAKQIARIPLDVIAGRGLRVGTLGKAMAQGLLAYFVGTQLLNLATRKQFTWQNKEEGHKLDAWIPDVTGKTPGFFISPLSVVAELTHDAYRFAFKKDNALDVASQILQNKMGPLARAATILWSGKNFSGEKIDGAWNRIKDAAIALAPTPLPIQAFASSRPGQTQRQLTAMVGLKTEPAPTPLQQIQAKATEFIKASGKPIETDTVYHEGSPHSELRKALVNKDDEAVKAAIKELRKTNKDEAIRRGQEEAMQRRFTGSEAMEHKFKKSLSPDEQQLYRDAIKQKREQYQRFLKAWRERNKKEQ